MGIWTHINGNVRIDNYDSKEEINKIIQNEFNNITLNYDIVPCYYKSNIRGYNVVMWEDLDECANVDKFEKWFNQLTHGSKLQIRQGILQIEIPYIENRLLLYNGERNQTIYYK